MPENLESEQNRNERLKPLVSHVVTQLLHAEENLRDIEAEDANRIVLNAINESPEEYRVAIRSKTDEEIVIDSRIIQVVFSE